MLGTKDHEENPIKKPWTAATTIIDEVGLELSQYQCDESHDHVQGRGKSHSKKLKAIPTFSQIVTVHKAFDRAAHSARAFACAVIALSDSFACPSTLAASFSLPPQVEEAERAGVSLPEGRPGTEFAYWR